MTDSRRVIGRVAELWRYPVKSMQGETVSSLTVGPEGAVGDRAYALIDRADGTVASAKNPKKWRRLLSWRAKRMPDGGVEVTAPDGRIVSAEDPACAGLLSEAFGRDVRLARPTDSLGVIEAVWPEGSWLGPDEPPSTVELRRGSFHDVAPLHFVTTATLDELTEDRRRFRPNLVIETGEGVAPFGEESWIGHTLVIGDVRLSVTRPCSRCVMTTLDQPGLRADPSVLRRVVSANQARVGAYAEATAEGTLRVGEAVRLEG